MGEEEAKMAKQERRLLHGQAESLLRRWQESLLLGRHEIWLLIMRNVILLVGRLVSSRSLKVWILRLMTKVLLINRIWLHLIVSGLRRSPLIIGVRQRRRRLRWLLLQRLAAPDLPSTFGSIRSIIVPQSLIMLIYVGIKSGRG